MAPDATSSNYVHDILAHAERQPEKPALVREGRTVLYGDLPAELGALVRAALASGVEPGQRVGIVTRDPIEDVLVRLALSSLGAVPCSLDRAADPARRTFLAQHFGLPVLLESEECFDGGAGAIRMDAAWRAAGGPGGDPVRPVEPVVPGAFMLLTSGTTGTPSGIVVGHPPVGMTRRMMADEGMIDADTVFLNQLPHFTNSGVAFPLLLLTAGGTSVIPGGIRSLDDLADAVIAHGITFFTTPPLFLGPLVEVARRRGVRPLFPRVRALMVGGDASDAAQLAAAAEWLTPGVMLCYASTSSGLATLLKSGDFAARAGSVGRPFAGVAVEVEGPDGAAVPAGTPGRVRLRGTMTYEEVVGPKAFNGEELRDGYVYPGDVGVLDPDGYLTILGRQSDVIRRDGADLYPSRIEARLRGGPGLREVTVAGVPDDAAGQVPVAFVVAGPEADDDALRAYAEAHLPEPERPARWVRVEAIPRNHLGKALRRELVAGLKAG